MILKSAEVTVIVNPRDIQPTLGPCLLKTARTFKEDLGPLIGLWFATALCIRPELVDRPISGRGMLNTSNCDNIVPCCLPLEVFIVTLVLATLSRPRLITAAADSGVCLFSCGQRS